MTTRLSNSVIIGLDAAGQIGVTFHPVEVRTPPLSPERFQGLLDPDAWDEFEQGLDLAREMFEGRVVWNVNSTSQGGGVAEILRSFTSYSRGAGLDMRWMAIEGTPEFFSITKRLHNFLHGEPGDGGELGPRRARDLRGRRPGERRAARRDRPSRRRLDPPRSANGGPREPAEALWGDRRMEEPRRRREPNELVHRAWDFIAPFLREADACVFSRHAYVPDWAGTVRTMVIQPSIDAFSPKNQDMDETTVLAILGHVGLLGAGAPTGVMPTFTRYDGSPGRVDRLCEVVSTGPPPAADVPLVTQVSRWDRLKDHTGVMQGFAEHTLDGTDAHLVLAGPNVSAVADDPEGAEVLDEVVKAWRELPQTSVPGCT